MNFSPKNLLNRYFAFLDRRPISDLVLFHLALVVVLGSGLWALIAYNNTYLTIIPTPGGTLVEGIVGTPRFVNPVLAITRADHDIAALVYGGLMKIDENGNLVNDAAESIELSEDGLTYHVKIREDVRFHDGSEFNAGDVAFTIDLIQNPDLKSPLRGNWENVTVEELNDHELNIVLPESYAPFIENFTVGILPREIWAELPIEQLPFSQHNTEPIGSGPYMITDLLRNKSGLINAYKLESFNNANQEPKITTIVFNFYQNEEELMTALQDGEIAGTPSLTLAQLSEVDGDKYNIVQSPLPRTFAVYFNQNKSPALRDIAVRQALEASVYREELVSTVLRGYGIPINSPIPTGFLPIESPSTASTTVPLRPDTILVDGGWQKNADGKWEKSIDDETVVLSVVLTTSNTPLFEETANYLAEAWRAIGVDVQVGLV